MNFTETEIDDLNLCDKCGKPVEKSNCAVEFSQLLQPELVTVFIAGISANRRHLLPMKDKDGNQVCPGSPSRVRLLGDPRFLNMVEQSWEEKAKMVFKKMNEEFGPPNTVI